MKMKLTLSHEGTMKIDEQKLAAFQEKAIKLVEEHTRKILKHKEKVFTEALRTNAKPPVKGEITKGKLKWRGITIAEQKGADGLSFKTWLNQRGKRISEILEFTATIKY